jgi:hypothetical protein
VNGRDDEMPSEYIENEFLKKHEKYDIRKIDLMKISAIEILLNIV